MGIKIICRNQRAGYDYFIEDKFECGMALLGTEVKSLRQGKGQINEAYVVVDSQGEVWLQNATIPHYDFGNINNHPETRKRKLLMRREEIIQMEKKKARAVEAHAFETVTFPGLDQREAVISFSSLTMSAAKARMP